MDIRRFTFWIGILFLGIGILGFFPAMVEPPAVNDPALSVHASHGRLFGLFPVNIMHNLVHVAFGVWGIVSAKDFIASRTFCRANAIIYGLLAILGLFPVLNTMFGLMPIHGNDIWLHVLFAAATGYYGYVWVNQYNRERSKTSRPARPTSGAV